MSNPKFSQKPNCRCLVSGDFQLHCTAASVFYHPLSYFIKATDTNGKLKPVTVAETISDVSIVICYVFIDLKIYISAVVLHKKGH